MDKETIKGEKFKKIRRLAFTLAEVLITLGIIGIVAEMTIPTLINQTQDAEFKAGMKKAFSVLAQTQTAIAADNGSSFVYSLSACDTAIGSTSGATCLKDVFKDKIKYTKECAGGASYGSANCFPDTSTIKLLSGTIQTNNFYLDPSVRAGFINPDGSAMTFYMWDSTCSSTYGDTTPGFCAFVTVDVNGFKKPNTWGKDIYEFAIFANTIRPFYAAMAGGDDCNVAPNNGYTCASKYMYGK